MADKRPLEHLTFTHRGKVFTCVVNVEGRASTTPEWPARSSNAFWWVTVAGVKRSAFERDPMTDTQENVISRVITWYGQAAPQRR